MQQRGKSPVWRAPEAAARAVLTARLCNHVAWHGHRCPGKKRSWLVQLTRVETSCVPSWLRWVSASVDVSLASEWRKRKSHCWESDFAESQAFPERK